MLAVCVHFFGVQLRSEPAVVLKAVLAHLRLEPLSPTELEATAASPAKVNTRASSRAMAMPKKVGFTLIFSLSTKGVTMGPRSDAFRRKFK
jgi:hypothetical protein